MPDLGAVVEGIHQANEAEQAFVLLSTAMRDYGIDRVCFTLVTDHPSINQKALHGLVSEYPEDWHKHYDEHSYFDVDPVVHKLFTSHAPFFWSDALRERERALKEDLDARARTRRMMDEAAEAGVADGIGVPFVSKAGEISGCGLSRDRPENSNRLRDLADIYFLSSVFYEKYMSLLVQTEIPTFTPRELEVLLWSAEGKTDSEIADIIGISFATVRFHWNKIFSKMQVNSRVLATTTAIRSNIIAPQKVGFIGTLK